MNAEGRSVFGRFFLSTRDVLCVSVLCMCVFVQEEKEGCGLWVVGSAFLEAFLCLQVFLGF
jgi:hypothetical protein